MAAAASNKTTTKKDLRYPEIEEDALQFILDSCESSISKYNKFLQVREYFFKKLLTWLPKSVMILYQNSPNTLSLSGKWINGFGCDISKATQPKTVSETVSSRLVY